MTKMHRQPPKDTGSGQGGSGGSPDSAPSAGQRPGQGSPGEAGTGGSPIEQGQLGQAPRLSESGKAPVRDQRAQIARLAEDLSEENFRLLTLFALTSSDASMRAAVYQSLITGKGADGLRALLKLTTCVEALGEYQIWAPQRTGRVTIQSQTGDRGIPIVDWETLQADFLQVTATLRERIPQDRQIASDFIKACLSDASCCSSIAGEIIIGSGSDEVDTGCRAALVEAAQQADPAPLAAGLAANCGYPAADEIRSWLKGPVFSQALFRQILTDLSSYNPGGELGVDAQRRVDAAISTLLSSPSDDTNVELNLVLKLIEEHNLGAFCKELLTPPPSAVAVLVEQFAVRADSMDPTAAESWVAVLSKFRGDLAAGDYADIFRGCAKLTRSGKTVSGLPELCVSAAVRSSDEGLLGELAELIKVKVEQASTAEGGPEKWQEVRSWLRKIATYPRDGTSKPLAEYLKQLSNAEGISVVFGALNPGDSWVQEAVAVLISKVVSGELNGADVIRAVRRCAKTCDRAKAVARMAESAVALMYRAIYGTPPSPSDDAP